MNKSGSIASLAPALVAAQKVMRHATKDSANPFFKSKYADFASVWDACREALNSNGLAVSQLTGIEGANIYVETVLVHDSGEWMSGQLALHPIKDDPQGIGSAITYARRYALSGLCCLATEDDDDGNAASGNKPAPRSKPVTPPPPAAPVRAPSPSPAPVQPAKVDPAPAQSVTASSPAAQDEQRGVIEDVSSKSGEKNGKPWTRYGIKIGGTYYNTFDTTDGENAKSWIGEEVYFAGVLKPSNNPKYKDSMDLVSIRRVDESSEMPQEEAGFYFGTDVA